MNNVEYQKKFYNNRKYKNTDVCKDSRVKTILKTVPKGTGKLLDIGCSDGKISRLFLERGYDVYGIDVSQKALNKAKQRGIKVKRCDITKKLPYNDKEFKIVFCGELLEHILNPTPLLKEIRRILKEEGKLIITIPNISSLRNAILIIAGSLPAYACIYNGPHVRDYCKKTILELLNQTDFKNIQVRGDRITIPIWKNKLLSIPSLIQRFCEYLIIECQKKSEREAPLNI